MEEDENMNDTYWKHNLYLLQEKAPKPKVVPCSRRIINRPAHYGIEYHGLIERTEAEEKLRENGEGAFLVRASKRSPDANTLCMLFDGNVMNYKLYYDGCHFVAEKRFDELSLLVADGLISMYIDKYASEYIRKMADEAVYEQSPYSQYTKFNENQSRSVASPVPRQPHDFISFTFKMPHYCDYCRNFLWGLVQQGVRCNNCGFAAHRKCSDRALDDCRPDCKYVKRMFAVDLTTLCMAHGVSVPPVITQCINEVEKRGLNVEGIYRVSGSHDQMEKLRRQFDLGTAVDLNAIDDIHTVAGLLKLYLRLLPQQLVPFTVFSSLLNAFNSTRSTRERTLRCRQALEALTSVNLRTLSEILGHLRVVASYAESNKMSEENLATIFSPTIFCTGTVPSLPQQQHVLLHFLIVTPKVTDAN
ncbi:unnamed protein product [Bursaphelenchus xylophilus]|uniref:(pine wood nematode) hypothetical protein n=1 Tax=Bursaphelenchus xylophilus TaxID=6326 RepID=A0A1I7STQ5_BURXY|nr:unnamed protein product [Bursaphelenchus xylophilus]CAG9108101.1 unnamed protein product [Bursaphelenchus xylophilus]